MTSRSTDDAATKDMEAKMSSSFGSISRYVVAGVTVVGLGSLSACLSGDKDEKDTNTSTAGTSAASGGSSTAGTQTGGSTATAGSSTGNGGGKACVKVTTSSPGIANFEDYDGAADLSTWSFQLGGKAASGIFGGSFGYGDRATKMPETFSMVEGHGSTYALSIADTESKEYGGGMGLWLSDCLDASAFSGVSFWVKGNAPTGQSKVSLLTPETTSTMVDAKKGTCAGDEKECLSPNTKVPVTDTWTEVKVAWADLAPGSNLGEPVIADGKRLSQLQFEVELVWTPDDMDVYHPTPAPYELVIDDVSFY
jgi:hypothetical protein